MTKHIPLILLLIPATILYAEDKPVIGAMQEYFDFAEYSEGSITPEQLLSIDTSDVLFIDTRRQDEYDKGHIPGAVNIEWRKVLAHRDEIPTDKPVVLYCDTGLLSSKAQFALRLAGRDNVKVIRGGYLLWKKTQKQNKKTQ